LLCTSEQYLACFQPKKPIFSKEGLTSMVITQQFLTGFDEQVSHAEGKAARFEITGKFQKLSSLQHLRARLHAELNHNLTWDTVAPIVARIPLDKQRKYADTIKYVQKNLDGHNTHIFRPLKAIAEKLSKSQQRYNLPMLSADRDVSHEARAYAQHGLCFNLACFWLKEQLDQAPQTAFLRLDDENVVGSQAAYAITKRAAALHSGKEANAASIGLKLTNMSLALATMSFANCAPNIIRMESLKALLISIHAGQHAIALFSEIGGSFLFLDANAGSYRVTRARLNEFLICYNEECLPEKWAGYAVPSVTPFNGVWKAELARRR
jgi:hypothetical protein